jgi:catechol 2,3-dioxygenase-like lactoylglutathione lyase family enzyme
MRRSSEKGVNKHGSRDGVNGHTLACSAERRERYTVTAGLTQGVVHLLSDARAGAALPCQDFERAKAWYREKLGFSPSEEDPGGAYYVCAEGSSFFIFPSSGKSSGDHTQVGFEVKDAAAEVAELKKAGVTFEQYDFPGLKTDQNGLATIEEDQSKGAWFKDSEGNLLAIFQRSS